MSLRDETSIRAFNSRLNQHLPKIQESSKRLQSVLGLDVAGSSSASQFTKSRFEQPRPWTEQDGPPPLIAAMETLLAAYPSTSLNLQCISFQDLTHQSQDVSRRNGLLLHLDASSLEMRRLCVSEGQTLRDDPTDRWIWFEIDGWNGKRSNGKVVIGLPGRAVEKVGPSAWEVIGEGPGQRRMKRVELKLSRGGVPLFEFTGTSNTEVDAVWGPIVEAMATNCCRVRYLYEPMS
ncbi:MAG: hypothetical protein M1825_005878 [Sarcosagium campestre]|nr:MAG: hypothetical protein M1825_005878 [Sarcosagium campestre]